MASKLKIIGGATLALLVGGAAYLHVAPPEMFRVGSNYSAKIVCSNVFIANRDAQAVLNDDVQAPGNPLLRLMKVSVDRERKLVHADLLGFTGKGLAVYRPGTGCATVPDGDVAAASKPQFEAAPMPAPDSKQAWPAGSQAETDNAVQALLADDQLTGPGMRAVVVIHKGKLIAQRYGAGFDENTPLLGWSMTKSVTAALVGMAVGDGKLKLDQANLWPTASPADGREKITVADLLAMSSGLRFNEDYGMVSDVTRMLYLEPDMAAFTHSQPLDHPVGTFWSYSSGTTVLLSRIWQQAVGNDALTYPQRRLFGPLGMHSATIEADARGNLVGSSYMYATAQDWARFGQFLLQDGVWNGQRLLPEGYVAMMRAPAPASKGQYTKGQLWQWGPDSRTPNGKNPDVAFGLPEDTVWMEGHDGQTVAIVPSKDLVLVRLGLTPYDRYYQPQGLVKEIIKATD
ncbi:MAG: serine hydrolase [Burkholderiaceae bacterium]|nr:serine hydrolase [Burkholderiaceae bacterium]